LKSPPKVVVLTPSTSPWMLVARQQPRSLTKISWRTARRPKPKQSGIASVRSSRYRRRISSRLFGDSRRSSRASAAFYHVSLSYLLASVFARAAPRLQGRVRQRRPLLPPRLLGRWSSDRLCLTIAVTHCWRNPHRPSLLRQQQQLLLAKAACIDRTDFSSLLNRTALDHHCRKVLW